MTDPTPTTCNATREDVIHDGRCHSCDEPAERHAPAPKLAEIVRRAQQAIRDRWRVSATQMAADYEPPSMSLGPPVADQTPTTDPARLDLDAIEADLDEVRRNVDHAEAQYNPHALTALRAAEALVALVRQLETDLAATRADRDRLNDDLGRAHTHIGETELALMGVATASPAGRRVHEQLTTVRRDGAADALEDLAADYERYGALSEAARDSQVPLRGLLPMLRKRAAEFRTGARTIPTTDTAEEQP